MVGAMQTADGRWRVEVGGVGSVTWYRLIGPGVKRDLPSLRTVVVALAEAGVDMADLSETDASVVNEGADSSIAAVPSCGDLSN